MLIMNKIININYLQVNQHISYIKVECKQVETSTINRGGVYHY